MNKLSDLATLMELKYQASQVELRSICVQEAKIREQIARLDQQSISTLSAGASTICLLYTSPSPRDQRGSRMPSSA